MQENISVKQVIAQLEAKVQERAMETATVIEPAVTGNPTVDKVDADVYVFMSAYNGWAASVADEETMSQLKNMKMAEPVYVNVEDDRQIIFVPCCEHSRDSPNVQTWATFLKQVLDDCEGKVVAIPEHLPYPPNTDDLMCDIVLYKKRIPRGVHFRGVWPELKSEPEPVPVPVPGYEHVSMDKPTFNERWADVIDQMDKSTEMMSEVRHHLSNLSGGLTETLRELKFMVTGQERNMKEIKRMMDMMSTILGAFKKAGEQQ